MDPLKAYKSVKTQTTSPQQAIVMAYDGIINFLNLAKTKMQERDFYMTNEYIFKARRLLSELTLALNDEAGELADNFRALYNYCYNRTIEANLRKNPEIIDEVVQLISPLADAWHDAVERINQEIFAQEGAVSLEEKVA